MLIFLNNSYGGKLYLNPEVLTPAYLIICIVNLILETAWIFIWDNELLELASADLFAIAITNVMSVMLLARNMAQRDNAMKVEQPKLYW